VLCIVVWNIVGVWPMRKSVIQIPIDRPLLAALDAAAAKQGRSRAAVIREACEAYLWRSEMERQDRECEEGYRRIPEDPGLAQSQLAMLPEVWPEEDWSDWEKDA